MGSIFLSASYCDNKKCFVIRDLIVLCDKPEWESAVRVWPLGGRVGRVTRFAGSPVVGGSITEREQCFSSITKFYNGIIVDFFGFFR